MGLPGTWEISGNACVEKYLSELEKYLSDPYDSGSKIDWSSEGSESSDGDPMDVDEPYTSDSEWEGNKRHGKKS